MARGGGRGPGSGPLGCAAPSQRSPPAQCAFPTGIDGSPLPGALRGPPTPYSAGKEPGARGLHPPAASHRARDPPGTPFPGHLGAELSLDKREKGKSAPALPTVPGGSGTCTPPAPPSPREGLGHALRPRCSPRPDGRKSRAVPVSIPPAKENTAPSPREPIKGRFPARVPRASPAGELCTSRGALHGDTAPAPAPAPFWWHKPRKSTLGAALTQVKHSRGHKVPFSCSPRCRRWKLCPDAPPNCPPHLWLLSGGFPLAIPFWVKKQTPQVLSTEPGWPRAWLPLSTSPAASCTPLPSPAPSSLPPGGASPALCSIPTFTRPLLGG